MGEVYYNSNGVILKDNKVLFSQYIPQVGDTYGGGIVILGGITGLTAMPDNIGSAGWGCFGTTIDPSPTLVNGYTNTSYIINQCTTPNIAAALAWNSTAYGYSDWYLPSINELRDYVGPNWEILGMVNGVYWSSTQESSNHAWYANFNNVNYSDGWTSKSETGLVRAIRKYTL